MKKSKKLLIALIALGVVVALVTIMFIYMMSSEKSKMKQLVFHEINMSEVSNGTYIGSAATGLVKVEVKVKVSDNRIIDIELLKHENGLGGKSEKILNEMVSLNTYKVDTVSGATVSSQTIKSAVSNALLKGKATDKG